MPKSTLASHPLHPMLVVAPAALIPFGFILDALHRATDDDDYATAAYYSLVGALAGGVAAGVAGAMDYATIESETDVKRTANVHAVLNGGALALTAANIALRRKERRHTGGSLALSALATLGVVVSGWFGARMVYEQGVRVEGASPVEGAPEAKPPGNERVERALLGVDYLGPASGPTFH